MTQELSRTSALASRHQALGSGLEDWNGMGTAWSYDSNPEDEHDAVRERAGMFDMSPLKKIIVRGTEAKVALDHLATRNIHQLVAGSAVYSCVLTDQGGIADDAIIYNIDDREWMVVHGSGDTMALLQASAEGRDVQLEFTDDLHDLSVQGPQSLDILSANCDTDLRSLAYFQHAMVKLFSYPCRISRTGYTGERGYEIFASADVIGDIWDKLVTAGVTPCSFTALDKVRIEAGLLFYGYDMTAEQTPWEVGLGFTVHQDKGEFRGKEAALRALGKESINMACLDIDHSEMVAGGEVLSVDGAEIGIVNSPCYSHRLSKSLALGHIKPGIPVGSKVTVSGDGLETSAIVVQSPIYDPGKTKTHA